MQQFEIRLSAYDVQKRVTGDETKEEKNFNGGY